MISRPPKAEEIHILLPWLLLLQIWFITIYIVCYIYYILYCNQNIHISYMFTSYCYSNNMLSNQCFFEELIAVTDERTYEQNVCATHNYKQHSSPNHLKLKICITYLTPSSWRCLLWRLLSLSWVMSYPSKLRRFGDAVQCFKCDRTGGKTYVYSTFCPHLQPPE